MTEPSTRTLRARAIVLGPMFHVLVGVLVLLTVISSGFAAETSSTASTIEFVQPRMVKIFGAGGLKGLSHHGTGFLVSKEGHIATAWSHVLDPAEVTVVLNDGRRFTAKVLGAEPNKELAVLKLNAPDGSSFPFFDLVTAVSSAGEGARVLAFSNMFQVAAGDESVSVLHGVIAAKTQFKLRRGTFEIPYEGPVYVVDAITNNSGAAGGLLTSRDGKLLGMIGREVRNAETNTWVNYSIPLTELRQPIDEIITGKFSTTTRKPADEPDAARRYDPTDFGIVMVPDVLFRTPAYVDTVVAGSAAAKVGLKSDDLVLFVNGDLMQSVRTMKDTLGRLEAGDILKLVVRRGDELVNVELAVPKKAAKPMK